MDHLAHLLTVYLSTDILLGLALVIPSFLFIFLFRNRTKYHRRAFLHALHTKAWGRSWPCHRNNVTRGEIGQIDDDDELYIDGGIADNLEYYCLDTIKEVVRALSAPLDLQDVLVVREEYDSILAMVEDYPSKLYIITGQPGIGKTTFLIYLLLYRLHRRLPTAVQVDRDQYFIFDEHGATRHDARADSVDSEVRLEKCWALCDSNGVVTQPCARIQSCAERIILTTSPKPERWKEIRKQLVGVTLIVQLPTVMEIAAALKELKLDTSATLRHVGKWGPSLRTAISTIQQPYRLTQHADDVAMAANVLSKGMLSASITQSEVGMMPTDGGSSLLFLSRHTATRPPRSVLIIPTKHLTEIFDRHAVVLTKEHTFDLFCMLSSHSLTRTSAAWMHEMAMHQRMMDAGEIQLFRGQEQMQMKTSTNLLHGTAGMLKGTGCDNAFYWMPLVSKFPGIDSVLGDTSKNLFTLQATIADDHEPAEEGISKIWSTMTRDSRENSQWHFVLVCSDRAQAVSLLDAFSKRMEGLTLGQRKATVKVWACVL